MLGKKRISELQSLHQKKFRIQKNKFFAEGRKIVLELLNNKYPIEELYATNDFLQAHKKLIAEQHISIVEINTIELQKISALKNPDDAFAVCEMPFDSSPEIKPDALYLFLDAIRDPGNLGSLIRLADWFSIEKVFLSSDCVEWTNPKVIQATMGSFIRQQPLVVDDKFWESIPVNIEVVSADLDGQNFYTEFKGSSGIYIISNEANGLSEELNHRVTNKVHIPSPKASAESLNAAMAAGILLGELSRRKFWSK
jgi:RNA methyltransferase, TrmH family